MPQNNYAYPFDPSGSQSSNLIPTERHIINPPDWRENYFIVPFVGPFFKQNLKVVHVSSGRVLVDGTDFVLGFKFLDATRATGRELYGAICFLDNTLNGVIEIDYQTLGGMWSIDQTKALELLSNTMNNPRISTWESVIERPVDFPVIDHEWDLVDMVGASEVVSELQAIVDAIYASVDGDGTGGSGSAHAQNRDNPHRTTKVHVGLGNVQNYSVATQQEAIDGALNDRYMTPLRVAQMIDTRVGGDASNHIRNKNNPHEVTKEQINLGSVQNYGIATAAQARSASSQTAYMTPELVGVAIEHLVGQSFLVHRESKDNPHEVTKSQVGLGNVEDYGVATEQQALAGTLNSVYMTPLRVTQAITQQAGTLIQAHITNTGNPHGVTKTQVGLGNVQNYGISSEEQALTGTANDVYMTPLRVAQVVAQSSGASIQQHVNNTSNPHNVTKAQVGLSDVQNYGVAALSEALAGANDKYVTPDVVLSMLGIVAGEEITSHVTNKNNPHNTTKAHVGLSNVQNFGIASDTQARNAVDDSVYMTPKAVGLAIGYLVGDSLTSHLANKNNPHGVTKAQVGLNNVMNYDIATFEEAMSRISDRYITPDVVAQMIESISGDALNTHTNNKDNPHSVTKSQVGLGSVQNYGIANDDTALEGTSQQHYSTPYSVSLQVDNVINPLRSAFEYFRDSFNGFNIYPVATTQNIFEYNDETYTTGGSVGRYVDGQINNLAEIIQGSFHDMTWSLMGNVPFMVNREVRGLPSFLEGELSAMVGTSNSLIVGTTQGQLGRYDGMDWVQINAPTSGSVIRMFTSSNEQYIYVVQGTTLYQTLVSNLTNSTISWTSRRTNIDVAKFMDVQCDGSKLAVIMNDSLFISTNSGGSFSDLTSSVPGLLGISRWYNGGIHITGNEIQHWNGSFSSIAVPVVGGNVTFVDTTNDGDLLYFYNGSSVYRESDGLSYVCNYTPSRAIPSTDGLLLYLSTNDVPFRSMDGGEAFYATHIAKDHRGFTHVGKANDVWYGLNTQGMLYGE